MNLIFVLGVLAIVLVVFLWALEKRWFGRFRRGFLAVLILAAGGIGLAASLLIGIWGYGSAERILAEGTVRELAKIGRIVEGQTERDIEHALLQMTGLARTLVPGFDSQSSPREIKLEFGQLERVNPRFLQFEVLNRNGQLVVSLSRDNRQELTGRVAAAYALEGQTFASDPYYSEAFQRYVLHLCAPVQSARGRMHWGGLSGRHNSARQGMPSSLHRTAACWRTRTLTVFTMMSGRTPLFRRP